MSAGGNVMGWTTAVLVMTAFLGSLAALGFLVWRDPRLVAWLAGPRPRNRPACPRRPPRPAPGRRWRPGEPGLPRRLRRPRAGTEQRLGPGAPHRGLGPVGPGPARGGRGGVGAAGLQAGLRRRPDLGATGP